MKNLLLSLAATLVTLVSLEAGLRALEGWQDDQVSVENQFIRATNVRRAFTRASRDGRDVYVRTEHHLLPRWSSFAADPDAETFRVFCLGGSAAMGWPHPGEWSYPALLQRKLEILYPERRFEVINAAGNTYASYRVKIVFDEILDYRPDAVVIYSGNNEFLENVVYRPPHMELSTGDDEEDWRDALALARFVERRLARVPEKRTVDVASYGNRDQLSNRLSFAFGQASMLRSDSLQFRTVTDHYVYNLTEMVLAGRRRGVPVVLATVPVNLRDWRPNASFSSDLTEERRRALEAALRIGVPALEAFRFAAAVPALERASRIDPQRADTWFDLGRALLGRGSVEPARQAFRRALELDAYPFRSLFDAEVREVAQRTGAPLADLSAAFARASPDGIPGYDLFLDYVHPTVRGNEIIAQEVLETLAARVLPGRPALPTLAARLQIPEVELDQGALRGLFGQILIMRQYAAVERVGAVLRRVLVARTPDLSPRERGWNDDAIARLDRTLAVVRPYRRMLRAERLGLLSQEFAPEQAERIFQDYVALIREIEGEDLSDAQFESYLPDRSAG